MGDIPWRSNKSTLGDAGISDEEEGMAEVEEEEEGGDRDGDRAGEGGVGSCPGDDWGLLEIELDRGGEAGESSTSPATGGAG